MTYLSGKLPVRKDQHRLLSPLNNLLILTTSITTAVHWIKNRTVNFEPGDYLSVASNQFDIEIQLPVYGPLEAAQENSIPDVIHLTFAPKDPPEGDRTPGFADPIMYAITPVFVNFYENSKPWLDANISTDPQQWPAIWNFGRVIRNATAHKGKLNFTNPSAPPVSWYHLTYGPPDNGREIIGVELSFADILILMVEMSDELDRLGCPV